MEWTAKKVEIMRHFPLPMYCERYSFPAIEMDESTELHELVDEGLLTWDGTAARLTSPGLELYEKTWRICGTSVQDGCMAISQENDLDVLRACRAWETWRNSPRVTFMKKLEARIRRLEKLAA